MNKEFDDILSERIRELPSRLPSANLWREIEAALDMEDTISSQLRDLPLHQPSAAIWETIEAALQDGHQDGYSGADVRGPVKRTLQIPSERADPLLPGEKRPGLRRRVLPLAGEKRAGLSRRVLLLTTAGVAAVVLILFMIPRLVRTEKGITVESEIVLSEEHGTPVTPAGEDEDPIEVIKDLCKTGAPVCQSELFREKMQLYQELNEELRQLETVIGQVGDSPEIIQSVIRIENLKSGTLQELIQLIHS